MFTLNKAAPEERIDDRISGYLPGLSTQALDISNVHLTFSHSNPFDVELEGSNACNFDTGEILLKDRHGEEIGSIVVSNLSDGYELFELLSIAEGPPTRHVTPDRLNAVLTILEQNGAWIRSGLGSTPQEISDEYGSSLERKNDRGGTSQILVEANKGEVAGRDSSVAREVPSGFVRFVDMEQPVPKDLESFAAKFSVDAKAIESWLRSAASGSIERHGNSVLLGLQIYSVDPKSPREVSPTPIAVLIDRDEIVTIHHGKVPAIESFMDAVGGSHVADESRKGTGALLTGLLGAVVSANRDVLSRLEHQADLVDARLRHSDLDDKLMDDAGKLAQSVRDVSRSLMFVKETMGRGEPEEVFGVKPSRKATERLTEHLGDVLSVAGSLEERVTNAQNLYTTLSANQMNGSMKALTVSGLVLTAGSFFVPLLFGASELTTGGIAAAVAVGAGCLYYLFRR